jgi:hypothetical protein
VRGRDSSPFLAEARSPNPVYLSWPGLHRDRIPLSDICPNGDYSSQGSLGLGSIVTSRPSSRGPADP